MDTVITILKNLKHLKHLRLMLKFSSICKQVNNVKPVLHTRWTKEVVRDSPHAHYPRPQLVREQWSSLNGQWDFQIINKDEAMPEEFSDKITVPFCVESELSGVKRVVGPDQRMIYRRELTIPEEWREAGRVRIHFEAVDYHTTVYIDKMEVGNHTGGYDAFHVDITNSLDTGHEIMLEVTDPTQTMPIPVGKQWSGEPREDFMRFIFYTSTSGVWQSVWMEPLVDGAVEKISYNPNIDRASVKVSISTNTAAQEDMDIEIHDGNTLIQKSTIKSNEEMELTLGPNVKTWSPEDPFLYDVIIKTLSGDCVKSYFGMRKIEMRPEGDFQRVFLNNKKLEFQIGLLDQGYWPDGVMTPPTEEAMKWDIEMTKRMGYNMIRKHIKLESRRWYYWADRLGMLVWQDFPCISDKHNMAEADREDRQVFRNESLRWIDQLKNHPSIIMWVVFNEGWGQHNTVDITNEVMQADPSRLVSCASGWTDHPVGHVVDVHTYPGPVDQIFPDKKKIYARDSARAAVVGEMWGVSRHLMGHNWFGDDLVMPDPRGSADTEEQFLEKYEDVIQQLCELKTSHGYVAAVMTQTSDVENELNGMVTYDRELCKCDPEKVAITNQKLLQYK